jgi:hypothetical protein
VEPRWRADGKELYFIAPDGKLMAVPVMAAGSTFAAGTPVPLFQTRIVGGGSSAVNRPQYAGSRDGRFLINPRIRLRFRSRRAQPGLAPGCGPQLRLGKIDLSAGARLA